MKSYRIYTVSADGRLQLGEAFEAENDKAASQRATMLARRGQGVELWEGGRIVGRVSKDGVFSQGVS